MHAHEIHAGCDYWTAYLDDEILVHAIEQMYGDQGDWICARGSDLDVYVIPVNAFLRLSAQEYSEGEPAAGRKERIREHHSELVDE